MNTASEVRLMEDYIDSKILRTLRKKGTMTCRAVQKATKLNDRRVRSHLKLLRKRRLIDQTRRGRSDCNSLTEKGEHLLIDDALGKIDENLATLKSIDKKISPEQWKALARLDVLIRGLSWAKDRANKEKQQALQSLFKVECIDKGEVGKLAIPGPARSDDRFERALGHLAPKDGV